jgi:hypothetical protein
VWGFRSPGIDVEAKEARWVELGGARGVAEPARADKGRTDKACGEAKADHDLHEEIVVIKHLGDGMPHLLASTHAMGKTKATLQKIW